MTEFGTKMYYFCSTRFRHVWHSSYHVCKGITCNALCPCKTSCLWLFGLSHNKYFCDTTSERRCIALRTDILTNSWALKQIALKTLCKDFLSCIVNDFWCTNRVVGWGTQIRFKASEWMFDKQYSTHACCSCTTWIQCKVSISSGNSSVLIEKFPQMYK